MAKEEKKKASPPVFKARRGNVVATVWEKEAEGKDGKFMSQTVTVQKNYKDKDGNWQSNTSFNKAETFLLREVINDAIDFVTKPKKEVSDDEDDE